MAIDLNIIISQLRLLFRKDRYRGIVGSPSGQILTLVLLCSSAGCAEEGGFLWDERAVLTNSELRSLMLALDEMKAEGLDVNKYKTKIILHKDGYAIAFEPILPKSNGAYNYAYEVWVNKDMEVTRSHYSK